MPLNESGCSKHWVLDPVSSLVEENSTLSFINPTSIGLLNHINNESLLESLLSILIGILSILSKSSQQLKDPRGGGGVEELYLEHYGELTLLVSQQQSSQQLTSSIFQHHVSTNIDQLDAVVREIILNTALRLNRAVEKVSFKSHYILGELYYEKNKYLESLRSYLMAFALQSSFFTNTRKAIDQLTDMSRIVFKLSNCLIQLGYPMQAVAVNQILLPTTATQLQNQTFSTCFKIIQDHLNTLDSLYFQYIFEIPILELLINHYNRLKDTKKLTLLNQLISSPILNEFNHPDIRTNFQKTTKINLLKSLAIDFLFN
ncbi:hypothetical protein DFA_08946 [Cavenderia fasciculata]|uniref:INTS8 TPR repeats domain-containing protein n=1 Tax=Cavenderia fasciculata TaxID=261658 RepID=F4Q552_CACFS|nr:uncharacterized protein DFA_08946 [Cavenderia fasciculata]EGG17945.1 hypothetical protein DFA_08946 [Cavenderia fasciculata]|eukprot:XP_004356429.1 hypothetical protein DFA_08946 [Cavenderia fasciculata]